MEKRLKGFSENYFDTIIIDEAHHAISDGYRECLTIFKAQVLGVTLHLTGAI
ncbi:MAG: DEAD/DEAH box helicase family protein [Ruminococcus bicirculans (ex Wegman et al. 2014)]